MKRLLFLLLLIPVLSFGQEVTTYGDKALTYGGDVATYAYCPEYQAVYDAYTTKPSDAVAAIDNTMVVGLVSDGVWAKLDVVWVYAAHINAAGEALLDWKQPAGGANQTPQGTFDSATGWTLGTGWSIANGKATCDGTAGNNYLSEDPYTLVAGKTYMVTFTVTDYTSGTIRARCAGGESPARSSTGTFTAVILSDGVNFRMQGASFNGSIDDVSVVEWTNATAYNAPTFTAYEGFLGNGTTQYIDCNWVPSVNGVNYTQNSASMLIYVRTNVNTNTAHGTAENADTKDLFFTPKQADGKAYIKTNDFTYISVSNADGSGMYINTRTAAAVNKLYRNKIAIINGTTASIGVPTHSPYCLAYNNDDVAAGFRADQVSLYAFGAGLTQTDVNNITDYYNNAMRILGKNVF